MTLPVEINPAHLASTGYTIPRSVRLRSSASAYLSRTPASTTNRKTYTISLWSKRGALGSSQYLISAGNASTNECAIRFNADNTFEVEQYTSPSFNYQLVTTQVFRDPSAWYHFVVAVDTTQATSSNRIKVYVNGVQVTAFNTTSYPSLNYDTNFNLASYTNQIGAWNTNYFHDGYMAEFNFIDGQALTASSFGYTDSNGIWQPKAYSGTYGTNGFYLPFKTNSISSDITSSATATAPFGGTANNAKVADSVYLTTNTTTGSAIDILKYDFGTPTQVTRYSLGAAYFTGGTTCTWALYGSNDDITYSSALATFAITNVSQNFSGSINANYRYYKLRAIAFGTNGQAVLDSLLMIQDGIGLDYSGNGNNWTPNNISLTAGATYDSMIDSPTNSAGASNYCTLNPLKSYGGLSQGNLSQYNALANWTTGTSTFFVSSGKWYWEVIYTNIVASTSYGMAGIVDNNFAQQTAGNYPGISATSYGYFNTANKYNSGAATAYGATYGNNDVIGVALDLDSGTITFYKNGVSQGTAFTGISGTFTPAVGTYGAVATINFGQQSFSYTPPSGYKALNTYNMPTPTISNGGNYFNATTYTGNGGTQSITNSGSMKPDFVWAKARNTAYGHVLYDSVRGPLKFLESDATNAEVNGGTGLTSFDANGFTTTAYNGTNATSVTYVGWQWRAGQGVTSSDTNGSITSTVSVNQSAGFSVVSYTATGSNATVGHGLGVAPSMIIVKNKASGTTNWPVYHKSLTAGGEVFLNATNAYAADSTMWQGVAPTSTVFSVGTNANLVAGSTIAYCWAEVAGYSKFGSYVGNGAADGPFVYCGFRPRWILIKDITIGTTNWQILDTSRNTYNQVVNSLASNATSAESVYGSSYGIDVTANGFKIRLAGSPINTSADTHIFAAFAENPFKISRAR